MTEKLKQLMHEQASAPHFDPVDVATLVAVGDRRIRRTRWAVAGGGAAAAVAVAALAPALLGGATGSDSLSPSTGRDGYPVTTGDLPHDMFAQGRVIWVMGSVIHYGEVTVDVGRPVDAFVRTEIGFVFAFAGEVWQVDGDAQSLIGHVDAKHPRLVSDEETPAAGWVDRAGTGPPSWSSTTGPAPPRPSTRTRRPAWGRSPTNRTRSTSTQSTTARPTGATNGVRSRPT